MTDQTRRRLSYANVMSTIAVFGVLGGTAIATHPGGQDTISSKDIIDSEVRSPDIANGEVKNADLAANSVGSGKIADRQVKNADLSIGASSSNTIADGGIQGVDVKDDTLTGTQIDSSAIGTSEIDDDAVTNAKIAFSAVDTLSVENGSLVGFDLAPDTVRGANLQFFSIRKAGFVSTDTDTVVGEFDGSAPVKAEVMRVGDTADGGTGGLETPSLAGSTRILQVTATAVFRGAPDNHSEPECQLEALFQSSLSWEPIGQPSGTYVAETGAGLAGGQATVTAVGGFVDDEDVYDVRLMCRVIQPGTGVEGDGSFTGGNMVATAYAT